MQGQVQGTARQGGCPTETRSQQLRSSGLRRWQQVRGALQCRQVTRETSARQGTCGLDTRQCHPFSPTHLSHLSHRTSQKTRRSKYQPLSSLSLTPCAEFAFDPAAEGDAAAAAAGSPPTSPRPATPARPEPLVTACRMFDMKLANYIESDDLEEILYMTAQDISREYGVYGRGTALL